MTRYFATLVFFFTTSFLYAQNPLAVHFIDVGQGDSIFVQSSDGKTMLIDAGENDKLAEKYLRSLGVQTIDVVVATHPHLDHIGGLPDIIKNFDVKSVIMPRVTSVTTVTYQKLLEAIQAKGLRITEGKAGLAFDLGTSAHLECLAPNSAQYEDLNDYSVVLKMTCGDVTFLFTGDATTVSEKEMLANHADKLKATILKVGHHGSASSSSTGFIQQVNPQVTVLSLGKDNKYGHPTNVVMNRIVHTPIFRTDMQGSIILVTDGKGLAAYSPPVNGAYQQLFAAHVPGSQAPPTVQAQAQPAVASQAPQAASTDTVYVTRSGAKYHKDGCRHLTNPIALSRSEAEARSYTPCAVCKP